MDDFSEAYWNADQLLVWVWCRDRDLVHRAADGFSDYGAYFQELKPPDGRVVMAETQGRWLGLSGLSLLADMQPHRNLSEIRTEVLNVLREGRLHALGLNNGEGNLKEIADSQWAGLSFYEDRNFRTYASPDNHFRAGATKWYGLKFKRTEVLGIWPDPLEDIPPKHALAGGASMQTWLRLPEIVRQFLEGREISEVALELYQALANGLITAEAEIHRIYNEPIRGGEVFKLHLEWPRIERLSRDWWVHGRARIDPPGSKTFEPNDPPVDSVFLQMLEELAKEAKVSWEVTLTKPYGNRAGGHPNDLDLATKIRCRRDEIFRFFGNASQSERQSNAQDSSRQPDVGRLDKATTIKQQRRGRPPGSGSLETADLPFLEEMQQSINRNESLSVSAAARLVADKAPGQSIDSTTKRLVKRYRKKYLAHDK